MEELKELREDEETTLDVVLSREHGCTKQLLEAEQILHSLLQEDQRLASVWGMWGEVLALLGNREKAADKVAALVKEKKPERLVMGFPKNMDGTEGPRAALYREFAEMLRERTGMDVVLWDERRTTIEAHNILSAGGKKMKSHRKNVDAVAASLILEGYLRFLGTGF